LSAACAAVTTSSPQTPTAATTAAALMACSPSAGGQHHLVGTLSVLRRECRQHHHLRDHGVGAFVSVRVLVDSWHPLTLSAACAAVTTSSPQTPTAATTAAALMACSSSAGGQHHLVGTLSVLRRECRQHLCLHDHGVGPCAFVRVLVGCWHPLTLSAACAVAALFPLPGVNQAHFGVIHLACRRDLTLAAMSAWTLAPW
jgi:hypothetical protein